ncbi:sugar-binding transcriptional regulator [Propionispora vibrioides]|uniref:Deoxyribonucleoside regulator n=1 Tax=Propionispora vibrioides TaxID=112903 RepID=A0A1H8XNE4_9FIRM|nr:sugar-binding transcriptional regulator [Propionispora vibrioides]SEP41327.1 deoxyribonucleoside regulator [Propionispora vibrioides]
MSNEEFKLLVRVTKKYYLLDMKQDEIAQTEKISKSTVSRLLNKAKELGYVKINLDFPTLVMEELEKELKDVFNLKHIYIAESYSRDERLILSSVSDGLSRYLNTIISDGDLIGVSWGETMTYMSENLKLSPKKGVKIVQLNGGVARKNISTLSEKILINFAENYDAVGYFLNVPSFVDNAEIANTIMQDSKIKEVLDLAEEADTVIFGIGYINKNSILVRAGYFSEKDYENLRAEGFVGDICSRYIKEDGSHATGELYNRVVGINLESIMKKKNSIGVVIGPEKAKATLAALKGGYVNSLFTDEATAKEIVNLYKRE